MYYFSNTYGTYRPYLLGVDAFTYIQQPQHVRPLDKKGNYGTVCISNSGSSYYMHRII